MENEFVTLDPHHVDGLPYVVLTKRDYEILCEDSGCFEPDVEPLPLKDKRGKIAHYLLPEDHFNELSENRNPENVYLLVMPRKKVVAKALIFEGQEDIVEVIKGSTVGRVTDKLESKYRRKRMELERDGIIANGCFTEVFQFDNPSEAARVVAGCPKSGNEAWVNGVGKRLHIKR